MGKLAGTVAGSAVPNWLRQTAHVADPFYRNTYDTNPLKKAGKQLVAAIPGASTLLPKKYDNLGNAQRRYDEGKWMEAVFNTMVAPWDSSTYRTNDVYQEIDRLNSIEGLSVTPPTAKRKFSYTGTKGQKHENYKLSGDEYEQLQEVQGQTAAQILEELVADPDYANLSDTQKDAAQNDVYKYAEEQAKRVVLPDYYSTADKWMDDISDDVVSGLIRRASLDTIKRAVNDTVYSLKNGWELPESKQALESLYQTYDGMSQKEKQKILDEAVGETAKYLEMRSRGISTEQYLDVVDDISSITPEEGYSNVRPIQRYEAITGQPGLNDKQKDAIMRAYMTDYDPQAKSPDTTEVKYDAIRALGLPPEGYTQAYRLYNAEKGTGKRDRILEQYVRSFGCSRSQAEQIYDIFAGKEKPWMDK